MTVEGDTGQNLSPQVAEASRPGATVMVLAALIIVGAVAAFYFVFQFAEADRQRGLQAWQNQLNIVADSRTAALTEWFTAQRTSLQKIAANPSLAFYLTELSWTGTPDKVTDGKARQAVIDNYLRWSASQAGFDAPPTGADMAANVDRKGRAGLAVTDASGKLLVSTPWTPPIDAILDRYRQAGGGNDVYTDELYEGPAGDPTLAFVAPVFAEQSTSDTNIVGYVIGIRPLDDGFFSRLRQPGDTSHSGKTYLVRAHANQIDYLSPLADGSAPLTRHYARDTAGLAAAYALSKPGGFTVARDYQGHKVMVTGRAIGSPDWTLVRTVSAQEALGEIIQRRNSILLILGLAILAVTVGLLLFWRHGASVRVAGHAARFEKLSRFLRLVTDSQPTAISAVDASGTCDFANRGIEILSDVKAADMVGKKLAAVLPPDMARVLDADRQKVLNTHQPVSVVHTFQRDGVSRIFKSDHLPLDVRPDGTHADGVLMVLQDITELVVERERRENNLRQLVTTLATIIDARDPYSAHHSRHVAEVAEAVAQEMQLPETEVETAEIAGALMNLGKIMVSRRVLTSADQITGEELEDIRRNILLSADLLKNVEFDGPVVATIRQVQAHWDGNGQPHGLKGEDILITARIVAVANSFVGMVSPRAHRAGLDFDSAIRLLVEDIGKAYDRRPVAALANYLDNHGGRTRWVHFASPPKEADIPK